MGLVADPAYALGGAVVDPKKWAPPSAVPRSVREGVDFRRTVSPKRTRLLASHVSTTGHTEHGHPLTVASPGVRAPVPTLLRPKTNMLAQVTITPVGSLQRRGASELFIPGHAASGMS
jgi:hypothetical protein